MNQEKESLGKEEDIRAQDNEALIEAAKHGHKEIVKELLDKGDNIHAQVDRALREAKDNGHQDIVELLQQYLGIANSPEQGQEAEPREYHEHINEYLMAVKKAQEKEQGKPKDKSKKKKDQTLDYE